eukprot:2476128-Heterocapsa_arctica.AAC.1
MKEHVDRMKEGQNEIHCITDEIIVQRSLLPFLEMMRRRGLEVFYMVYYMVDSANEYVQQLKEFDGKRKSEIIEVDCDADCGYHFAAMKN